MCVIDDFNHPKELWDYVNRKHYDVEMISDASKTYLFFVQFHRLKMEEIQ